MRSYLPLNGTLYLPGWRLFHHNEAVVVFELTIRRKPFNILQTVVIPIAILSILNICVFVLPCESGERAGYAITVFLAFAEFMTVFSSTLPETFDRFSLFSMYLVIQMATAATPLHQKLYGGLEDLKKTTNFITAAGLVV